MKFYNVCSYDKALSLVKEQFLKIINIQKINTEKGYGRIVSCDILSEEMLPYNDKSTVDGFALKASNTFGASDSSETMLSIIGNINIGYEPKTTLEDGQAMQIPTGGMLPLGADAVVMIEHTLKTGDMLLVNKAIAKKSNVILEGEDIKKGDILLKKATVLNHLNIGMLKGIGVDNINVFSMPKVYIISTGDELLGKNEPMQKAKIRNINGVALKVFFEQNGYNVVGSTQVVDKYDLLYDSVQGALKTSDIVVISGGSSVGEKDYTEKVVSELGTTIIKGISLKPGKPTIVGVAQDKTIVGLPGHPMAAIIVAKMLVDRAYKLCLGRDIAPKCYGLTTSNFPSSPGRTTIQAVQTSLKNGEVLVTPLFGKSGLISPIANADGYIIIEDNAEGVYKGQKVAVYEL